MTLTLSELLQSCAATLAILLLVIPTGFVLGWFSDVLNFRLRSATEQLLWSVTLSLPTGLVIANILGRYLPRYGTLSVFFLLDLLCAALLVRQRARRSGKGFALDRQARIVLIALLVAMVYILLAGLPIRFHHRLFEPVFSSDWEIRLPLIQASVRDGVPPHNPFFTYRGQSPSMRYYYYWYSLCAQVIHLLHTGPRAALLASSVYALLSIVATFFLYLKYMVHSSAPLRRRCVLLLGLCCVLGLDVIPSTLGLRFFHVHLLPEIEWWAQDRSPGLPGAIVYAPHHIAGAACGFLAFLLLSVLGESEQPIPWRTALKHGALVAVVFAALAGTSTFICMFFAVACTVLCLDRLRRGDPRTLSALVLAGVLSVLVSLPYLNELRARTVAPTDHAAAKHLLQLRLRDLDFGHSVVDRTSMGILHRERPSGLARLLLRAPIIPVLYLSELGFYVFVVILQFRYDFRSGRPPSAVARAMWILAGSIGVFFFFINSAPVQGINDLGLQAGVVLRLVFVIWGAQVLAWYLAERQHRVWTPRQQWSIRIATAFLILGALMTVWQVTVERIYLALVDRGTVPVSFPFPQAQHIATVYNDIYEAQHGAAHLLPRDAVVQSNPLSRFQTIFRLYQERRQAAGDISCEGAFGGDPAVCQGMVPSILKLYGVHRKPPEGALPPVADPADMTPAAMDFVCRQDGIAAMMASRFDPVWYRQQSWVWRGELLYANRSVRVIRCPAA